MATDHLKTEANTVLRQAVMEAGLQIGQVLLNRYEIRRMLGRGAMGEVLEVLDRQSGVEYALKRVPPDMVRDAAQMAGIRTNFALVSQLTHPHIGTTRQLELDPNSGHAYLLMDLIRGCDLSKWIMTRREKILEAQGLEAHLAAQMAVPLPFELVLGIAEQLAMALDYAHSQPISHSADGAALRFGILHRDLKPANVMVETGREFRPGVPFLRIVDFGLAAEIQASLQSMSLAQRSNHLAGTPLYMAPEQWEGRTLTCGVDQWALGVLIYDLAAGRPPFSGPTETAIVMQICRADPEKLELLSDPQWAALKKTLQVDRKQRHESCLALVHVLAAATPGTQGLLQSLPAPMPKERHTSYAGAGLPPHDSAAPQAQPARGEHGGDKGALPRRKSALKWLALAVAVAAIGALGWLGWGYWVAQQRAHAKEEAARLAKEQLKAAETQAGQALLTNLALADKARRDCRWEDVIIFLESPLEGLGEATHPSKAAAESLLAQARIQLSQKQQCEAKLAEADGLLQRKQFTEAEKAYQNAKALWPEAPASWVKRADEGFQVAHLPEQRADALARGKKAYEAKDYSQAFPAYKEGAELGDAQAQNCLGVMYANGRGVPKDEAKAVEWYRKAAEQGHVIAQNNLGVMYANGRGVPKDEDKAVEWYRKAAEQGNANAQDNLGWMYTIGRGVPKDDAKAVEWYRKAAEQGNANAQKNLGWMYASGSGVPKDDDKAVEWYRKAAEQGNANAQGNLGWMYATGRGVPKDDAKAVEWYRKAAEHGNATAQDSLGWRYANGRGVPKDDDKAVEWYRKAVEQGLANAQNNLGGMYASGRGVPKDDDKAVEYYRKAAEQGNTNALDNLGCAYASGRGVPKDDAKAVECYRKAAEQGHANAQNNLGAMYATGRGVPKDDAKAVECYRKAAEQGHVNAQTNLGAMYEGGRGVTQDTTEAIKWYQKAAIQGEENAKKNLTRLGKSW